MTRAQLFKAAIKVYEEFYRQVGVKSDYKFQPRKADYLVTLHFIEVMQEQYDLKQIDIDFIIDYTKFQFSNYVGKSYSKYGSNAVMYQWIFGKNAFKRWVERPIKKKWIVRCKLKDSVVLDLRKAFRTEERKKILQETYNDLVNVKPFEEAQKETYFNTDQGFANCVMFTTLYNKRSRFCKRCVNKEDCIKIMIEQFPKLHALREKDERSTH